MSRSRGKRYDTEAKLNKKKVAAVIIAILVIIMFVIAIKEILKDKPETSEKSFAIAYYSIYEDGKWGVIDTKENILIKPTYNEMIVIPDNTKPVFVCMDEVNYDEGTYKSKAINEKGETLFTDYDKVEVLTNHDKNNNLWYEKNVLKVEKDGKYGLINLDGKIIAQCEYDNIEVLVETSNVYLTTKENKKGIVDNVGNIIIENKYDEIKALTTEYENGFIVKADGKYGVIGYDKNEKLEAKYDEIKNIYGNNMYVAKIDGSWKVVDTEGNNFLEGQFDDIKSIQTDNVVISKNGKYGVISTNGDTKIEALYDNIDYAFSN